MPIWIQCYPARMPVWIQKKKNTVPRKRENDVLSQWQTGVEWCRLCLLWRQTSPYAGFRLIDHRCEIEKSLPISENIWDKTLTKRWQSLLEKRVLNGYKGRLRSWKNLKRCCVKDASISPHRHFKKASEFSKNTTAFQIPLSSTLATDLY